MSLVTLARDASVEELCATIERDGGVILEEFIDPHALAGLRDDLLPVLDALRDGPDDFSGYKTKRAGGIFRRTRHADALMLHPLMVGGARHFLQRPTDVWFGQERVSVTPSIQLGVSQAIQIRSGEGRQPLHRDDSVFQWRHPNYGREARFQLMLAVSDFTAENGGTLVVPGSHKWDDERMPRDDEAVSTVMSAGSGLLFVGSTYHGGGTNNTDEPRTGLTLTYDLGMLRQEENQYLSVPLEVVQTLDPELQRILGYEACPPFMGWVEIDGHMTDPSAVLGREQALELEPSGTPALPS